MQSRHAPSTSFRSAALITRVTALLAAVVVPSLAFGADPGLGTFTWNKSRLPMIEAYAYQKPDTFDAKKKVTVVVLTTVKLDRKEIDGALDRESAIDEQVRIAKGSAVQFTIGADGSLGSVNAQLRLEGRLQSFSTSGSGKADLKVNTAERITGRVQSGGVRSFSDDKYAYDFTVDIPVTPEPPPGTPLPAGGGDAGKAYVAFIAAVQKGDADAIARYWPKEKAAAMLAAKKEPDFKETLEMLKTFSAKTVTVKGGTLRAEVADLDVVGKDADGNVMDGKVRMAKDGTSWRVVKEDLTTHTK